MNHPYIYTHHCHESQPCCKQPPQPHSHRAGKSNQIFRCSHTNSTSAPLETHEQVLHITVELKQEWALKCVHDCQAVALSASNRPIIGKSTETAESTEDKTEQPIKINEWRKS